MSLIKWEEKYSVGVESMDNQHKKLVQMINDIFDELRGGATHESLLKIIEGLVEYTQVHFKAEEAVPGQEIRSRTSL